MRKLILLTLLILIPTLCFAGGTGEFMESFQQMPNNLSIDLANTAYIAHNNNPTWDNSSTNKNGYSDEQMIGIAKYFYTKDFANNIGFKITLESTSNPKWCFIYEGADTRYLRPFGIRMIGKPNGDSSKQNTAYNLYADADVTNQTASITIGRKDLSYFTSSIFWDILLEFKNKVDTNTDKVEGTNYNLIKSDSYYTTTFRITVERIVSDSSYNKTWVYDITLRGYYGTIPDTDENNCTLIINRLSGANNLNIETMFGSGNKVDVATYNLMTSSKNTDDSTKPSNSQTIKLFLSSNSDGLNSNAGEFVLKRLNSNGAELESYNNTNSLKYYAYLISDDTSQGHASGSTSAEVKFDGRGYATPRSDTGEFEVKTNSSNITFLEIPPTSVNKEKSSGKYNYLTRWINTGKIAIEIPGNQTIDGQSVALNTLESGLYYSTIYIHVITNN